MRSADSYHLLLTILHHLILVKHYQLLYLLSLLTSDWSVLNFAGFYCK